MDYSLVQHILQSHLNCNPPNQRWSLGNNLRSALLYQEQVQLADRRGLQNKRLTTLRIYTKTISFSLSMYFFTNLLIYFDSNGGFIHLKQILFNSFELKLTPTMGIESYNFTGKRAIIRVDFNVPIDKVSLQVQDDKRIRAAIPTIKHILSHGGSVVLLSHFGRPKHGPEEKFSLRHIVGVVAELLSIPVSFCEDFNEASRKAEALNPGEVMLVENVRFHTGETAGDLKFASLLASLGHCYVNDAFGSAHRAHASTTQIASFFPNDRMMGFLMEAELLNA